MTVRNFRSWHYSAIGFSRRYDHSRVVSGPRGMKAVRQRCADFVAEVAERGGRSAVTRRPRVSVLPLAPWERRLGWRYRRPPYNADAIRRLPDTDGGEGGSSEFGDNDPGNSSDHNQAGNDDHGNQGNNAGNQAHGLESFREGSIHDEAAVNRRSMRRIMARRMKATAFRA
jgi:hypothetical protein